MGRMASQWRWPARVAVLWALLAHVRAQTLDRNTVTMDTRACLPPHDAYDFCNTQLTIEDRVTVRPHAKQI